MPGSSFVAPIDNLSPLSEGVTYRYNLWRINADTSRDLMAYGAFAVALSIRPVLLVPPPAPGAATADNGLITADSSLITADAA